MYQTSNIILKQNHPLQQVFKEQTALAKLFKNACIYRLRQLYFAWLKDYQDDQLQDAQQEILEECNKSGIKITKKHMFPTYPEFVRLFTVTKNPDYYNDLSQQSSQQIIKETLQDFKGFFKSMKEYQKHPEKFTGRPKLPKYCKPNHISFDITNQDAVIYQKSDGSYECKLPKTKHRLDIGSRISGRLKEVTVIPFYDTYKVCLVFDCPKQNTPTLDPNRILGLDPGVNNLFTSGNNCGLHPFIINGKIIKSRNQYANKQMAALRSLLPENTSSKQIKRILKKRNNYILDTAHKIACYITSYCVENQIGTLVIGKNVAWKKNVDMKKHTKQNFLYIPYAMIIRKIQEKAESVGIQVVVREESYTSQASFLDFDYIPTYGDDVSNWHASGKRIHRGIYRTSSNIRINSDVNGACNIIRKEFPNAFDSVQDFHYLIETVERVTLK